jgi:prolyl-tRNA editing enzyme YbaK/EbsC (Cys-tRNA(Pro) deacylase)
MTSSVLQSIRALLESESIAFREVHHAPTFTSEDSAKARGEELRTGGKAILLKVDADFRLFVLSAALKVDSAGIKQRFTAKKLRFATSDELLHLTGLVPGSVPPFGEPVLPFELFVDPSIQAQVKIAFNAGSLTDSIVMRTEDYLRIARPIIFPFAAPT